MFALSLLIGLIPGLAYGSMAPLATKIGGSSSLKTLGITFVCFIFGLVIFIIEMAAGTLDYTSK
jgi:glucose uptake protein GlcU